MAAKNASLFPAAQTGLSTARRPLRRRGIERLAYQLDVTEALPVDHANNDATLATNAEGTEVLRPSLHHLFPDRAPCRSEDPHLRRISETRCASPLFGSLAVAEVAR